MWEKFDESTMGIVVRNIKRFERHISGRTPSSRLINNRSSLPDNVFDPGERQPKQAQKPTKVCYAFAFHWQQLRTTDLFEGIKQVKYFPRDA
ncbi:hypothetical protein K435DRAFT_787634 [Dendrothele bispora CBS 962.96]|uniref:Uncharacterized protein n=1 Tax=Dendrothele bispora (strain CBS 962.96) TaxID=1314807 RepID=A0A4S8KIF5_DENBC|nr:hypothetical protein K435DRAFT_787634 [Dendrothele bispora CBS 962.96]